MMTDANIIDVNSESFELEVLHYSAQVPVVMEFWAPWSIPARVQSPLLVKLAMEAQGAFRLARVNVDDQEKLAERLKVRTVPTIIAFVNGRMVSEYAGVLAEEQIRDLLKHIIPDKGDLLLEKGQNLILLGDYTGAEEALQAYLKSRHTSSVGMLAYGRVLLLLGRAREAALILERVPLSHESASAEILKNVADAYLWEENQSEPAATHLEAVYLNGLRLARKGNIPAALDGFLGILRANKHYRDGGVHQVYLGLLELLGEFHPEVRQYRTDLSNVLF